MSPSPPPSRALAYLLLTLTVLFWSGNWVVGRWIRDDVPPIALSFWRWVIAFACLLPWAWPHLRRDWPQLREHWKVLALLGMFGGACHNALTYTGVANTTATNGVLLASATPIMIIGLSWLLLGKRLRPLEWLGVAVSFSGVLAILARGELVQLLALRPNAGDLWVLAAMLFWALYTVLLVHRPAGLHALSFLAAITLWGLAGLAPFYLWEIAAGKLIVPGGPAFAAIAYAGIFPAALGFIFWNRAVAEVGGNRAGQFMHLMPAFGTLLAIVFLGEQPALYHLAGIALILAGIFLTTRVRA
ncbi:MAG: DMT family transporter [Zoogloeaceae bacterium]|nr:DMT family transporter [Zoogloeaceae bacterium]MCK6382785.1 DMT family transporter [Rhodocyclaceae bacterium]